MLVSALLTAGYLLPVTIHGFLPGAEFDGNTSERREPPLFMLIPVIILTALTVAIGLFPNGIIAYLSRIITKIV